MCTLDKIIFEMKKQKISQKELMQKLNLSESTFSMWKSGVSKSYLKLIPTISEILGVSSDYLLGINFEFNQADYNEYAQLKELFCKCFGDEYDGFIQDFSKLSKTGKKNVCDFTSDEISKDTAREVSEMYKELPADKQEIIINTIKGFIGG